MLTRRNIYSLFSVLLVNAYFSQGFNSIVMQTFTKVILLYGIINIIMGESTQSKIW